MTRRAAREPAHAAGEAGTLEGSGVRHAEGEGRERQVHPFETPAARPSRPEQTATHHGEGHGDQRGSVRRCAADRHANAPRAMNAPCPSEICPGNRPARTLRPRIAIPNSSASSARAPTKPLLTSGNPTGVAPRPPPAPAADGHTSRPSTPGARAVPSANVWLNTSWCQARSVPDFELPVRGTERSPGETWAWPRLAAHLRPRLQPGLNNELSEFGKKLPEFRALGLQVFGISVDSTWSTMPGDRTRLAARPGPGLSDFNREFGEAYGRSISPSGSRRACDGPWPGDRSR